MFFAILLALRNAFKSNTLHDSLEAYIVAGNPQTSCDVDRLERQFWDQRQRQAQFFFHE